MKLLDKFLCAVGRHELTTWRRIPPAGTATLRVVPPGQVPANERHCKRAGCKYTEAKRVRARKPTRPANEADTVTGATK